ncbi:MAG TPA: YaiI/YqxD family protein [Allosphingosinicella sp.]|nr:YaiI/YqxD family protein [Allosphingosinicella sp.]
MTSEAGAAGPLILVDGDACPVKDEIYKVAFRHEVPVTIVSNDFIRVPQHPLVSRTIVGSGFDAADDWIAAASGPWTVVITADILLADRCLKAGSAVISPTGRPFTDNSIGAAIATRAIMADLRAGGDAIGGPAPFSRQDRSRFLSALDEVIVRLKRSQTSSGR